MDATIGDLVTRAVDRVLGQAIETRQLVGAVAMVSQAGRLAHHGAYGWADREARIPAKLDTIFRWASLTKPVTAVLTLALAERGVLSLQDPVTRFLPEFRPRLADGREPVITLRHLVTHTAGLTYGLFEPGGEGPYHAARVSDGMDQPGLAIEENLRRIATVPLAREPGSGWGYSIAADVLGAALERARGKPLPELVREHVTEPLGMADSGFVVRERARLAAAYSDGAPEPVRMGARHPTPFNGCELSFAPDRMFAADSYPSGGGGMSGTAGDFMRLLEALRGGGAPVLGRAAVEQLASVKPGDFEVLLPGWKWPLGWSVLVDPAKTQTPQRPGSWTWGGVYGASWFVDPSLDLSVVLLTNTATAGMLGPVPDALRDAVYGALGA
jgi:CubicO group peptidase (beta-lactamase class C family)